MKWLDTYIPKAQTGTKIPFKNPEHPFTNKSLFEQYTPIVPEDSDNHRVLKIKDNRKILATSQQPIRPNSDNVSGDYNSYHLDELMNKAKKSNLSEEDRWNLAAMAFQETKWGRSDDNIGHVKGDWKGNDPYTQFINAYKTKQNEATRLGYNDPQMRLQVYNGMGTVKGTTEQDYHGFKMKKIYGVDIPPEGISMKQNPLYGKQILDIRDNVLKNNPNFVKYMDSIQKAPIQFGSDYIEPLHPEELRQDSFEDIPKDIPKELLKLVQKKKAQNGGIIEDDRGQWAHPGKVTKINSNEITMKGVNYPLLGISDTGDVQYMQPNQEYKFEGNNVTEFPLAQNGKTINLNEISLKTKLSQSDKVKAYRDSLNLYNKGKIEEQDYFKLLDELEIDKDRIDIYPKEYLSNNGSFTSDKIKPLSVNNAYKAGSYGNRQADGSYNTGEIYAGKDSKGKYKQINIEDVDTLNKLSKGFLKYKKPTKPEIEKVNHLSQKDIEFEPFIPSTELAPSPFYEDSWNTISYRKNAMGGKDSTSKKFNTKKELDDYVKYEEGIGHDVKIKADIKRKKAQTGERIIVNSKDDPRYIAYKDNTTGKFKMSRNFTAIFIF